MQTVIDWETLRREIAQQEHGSLFCDDLESLLGLCDGSHVLTAHVWADHGVRDEEGIPSEYEDPAVYITLSAMILGTWHGRIENILPTAIPVVAAALEPQIQAAVTEAWRQVTGYHTRFLEVVQSLENQRLKVQALSQENPCVAPSAR